MKKIERWNTENAAMIKVKVSDLSGVALDYAIAKVLDSKPVIIDGDVGPNYWACQVRDGGYAPIGPDGYSPSTDWYDGGPLIDKYDIDVIRTGRFQGRDAWSSVTDWSGTEATELGVGGGTFLIAICRAVVWAKMGEEIEVPEELINPS